MTAVEPGGLEGAHRIFRRRLALVIGLVLALAIGLVARWWHLQLREFDHYARLSHDNRLTLLPVGPERGLILDRNGALLARNSPSYSLSVGSDFAADVVGKLGVLRQVVDVSPTVAERLGKVAGRSTYSGEVLIKGLMTEEEVSRFVAWQFFFPEIVLRAGLARDYPHTESASHVIGHVGRISEKDLESLRARGKEKDYRGTDFIGKTGVEKRQAALLHGLYGVREAEIDAHGRILRSVDRVLPRRGRDVYLTLDLGLQRHAEGLLGEESGAVVVLDVWTGEVLALASSPRFDVNLFVHGIDQDNWRRLNEMEQRPLVHRAIYGQYAPGSTIKPFLALAALGRGWREPGHVYRSIGHYDLTPSIRFHDWKAGGHGDVDFHKSIVRSVNSFYYSLAHEVGIEALAEGLEVFGFGQPTGIDIPGEKGGILPTPAWKQKVHGEPWYPGDTVPVGVGQGYLHATPLQMARAMAMIANGGRMIRPHLLLGAEDPPDAARLASVGSAHRGPERAGFDPAHLGIVRDALAAATQPGGTAVRVGRDAAYPIAGKTGTAQVSRLQYDESGNRVKNEDLPKRLRDHAWFVGYAPADLPRVAVAVIVEHGGSGGRTAGPIARSVLDRHLLGTEGIGVPEWDRRPAGFVAVAAGGD